MKFIFMLLILFVLADPVMAKPVNNTAECLNMYQNYMEEYGASNLIPEAQILDFIGHCLPDDAFDNSNRNSINSETDHEHSQPQNLLHRIDEIKNLPISM